MGIAGGSHARTEELILGAREFRWGALVLAVAPLAGCEAPDPPPAAPDPPPAGLSVELIDVTAVTDGPGGRGRFWATVRFRNAGPDPVWVLRPLDGSRDGRLMPHYRLTGPPDADDRVRGSCPICGKWFNTEWPRDYLVEVPAGRAAQVRGQSGAGYRGPGGTSSSSSTCTCREPGQCGRRTTSRRRPRRGGGGRQPRRRSWTTGRTRAGGPRPMTRSRTPSDRADPREPGPAADRPGTGRFQG